MPAPPPQIRTYKEYLDNDTLIGGFKIIQYPWASRSPHTGVHLHTHWKPEKSPDLLPGAYFKVLCKREDREECYMPRTLQTCPKACTVSKRRMEDSLVQAVKKNYVQ